MKQTRILVVEDEAIVSSDIQSSLVRLGYPLPHIVGTGIQALRFCEERQPDLALMDIKLEGEIDGIEAARQLTEKYGIPVIFVTAYADEEIIAKAKETQPFGYLLKPFNEQDLQSTVEMALARSQTIKRLKESEQRFISTLKSMNEGVIATDLMGNITFINLVAEQLTGWTLEEADGKPLQNVFRVTDSDEDDMQRQLPIETEEDKQRLVYLINRDGKRIPIQDSTTPIKDDSGSLTGLVVVFRKRRELAPSASEGDLSRLSGVLDSISDPLFAIDNEWRITYVNDQAADSFECNRDHMIGACLWDHVPISVHDSHHQEFEQALKNREPRQFEFYRESKNTYYEVKVYPFADGLLAFFQNINQRKESEMQIAKVEKLESLGFLARGFAHDFNNLLTVLLGNISLTGMKVDDREDPTQELAAAKGAAQQAQNLVQQLLTFARGGAPIKQRLDLQNLLQEHLHSRERQTNVEYNLMVDGEVDVIEADKNQLKRLIENLIHNSEQAMPKGGSIVIRLTGIPGDEVENGSSGLDPEFDYAALRFEDNGCGIPKMELQKVFEPYFSARFGENASGIGLTVCESIAKGHRGRIFIRSQEEAGTIVSVYLPLMRKIQAVEPLTSKEPVNRATRVLILEDESLIRQLMVANLSRVGYDVAEAEEGQVAIEAYKKATNEGRPFDLVIMDLSIPNGMGGAKAMEHLLQFDAGITAIVSSGYSDDPVMARYQDHGFSAVLPKPYEPNELLTCVADVLKKVKA